VNLSVNRGGFGHDGRVTIDFVALLADLADEHEDLDHRLPAVDDPKWRTPTAAPGWTVLDQVAHLAEGEELAGMALTDEAAFAQHLATLLVDVERTGDEMVARARAGGPARALGRWRTARAGVLGALLQHGAGARVMWITGPMSSASFATARLMETWAHGQDVADALGIDRPPTARLRHIAHLGVATRAFAFANRGMAVPAEPRVALTGPAGESWTWGPDGADEWVDGPALDFCLVVTQRRHVADTDLVVHGGGVRTWMGIAQAFAGPPTDGPPPLR
jgi:uncharacterized protein (TIGR03084 family)